MSPSSPDSRGPEGTYRPKCMTTRRHRRHWAGQGTRQPVLLNCFLIIVFDDERKIQEYPSLATYLQCPSVSATNALSFDILPHRQLYSLFFPVCYFWVHGSQGCCHTHIHWVAKNQKRGIIGLVIRS